jgi:tRNA A37 threonylcarbamoyladenosine modification protein TsaB
MIKRAENALLIFLKNQIYCLYMKTILIINTADKENIYLAVEKDKKVIDEIKIKARFKQSEKLLVGLNNLIRKNNLNFKDIKMIKVAACGDSFTSLRIGVVTANALAYALNIDVSDLLSNNSHKLKNKINIIKPKYNTEPHITIKKNAV